MEEINIYIFSNDTLLEKTKKGVGIFFWFDILQQKKKGSAGEPFILLQTAVSKNIPDDYTLRIRE